MSAAPEPFPQRRRAACKGRGFLMLLITALVLTCAIAILPLLSRV